MLPLTKNTVAGWWAEIRVTQQNYTNQSHSLAHWLEFYIPLPVLHSIDSIQQIACLYL